MEYELTKHARLRLLERKISKSMLKEALENPTKIGYDSYGNTLFKKLYVKSGKQRLLLVAGRKFKNKLKIFTIIETSKTSKYL